MQAWLLQQLSKLDVEDLFTSSHADQIIGKTSAETCADVYTWVQQ